MAVSVDRPAFPRRFMRWIGRHANVQTILPLAVALGMLAYVSSLAAAKNSGAELANIIGQTWALILILTFPYLAARALVWYRLLSQLGIRVPLRQAAVSFAGGEITKSLPAGVYVENYLLSRLVHFSSHSLIRSSMATTAMLGLEAFVAVPIALIVGVPGERWAFWVVLGVVIAWMIILALAWIAIHSWLAGPDEQEPSRLQRAARAAEEFLAAGGELLSLGTLLDAIPTALYMLVYVIDFYAILRAEGVHNVTFLDTMSIYAFIVLAVILVPIPTEIGITEFTGLGVLLAYGIPRSSAAVAVLALRILATGMTILVAGAALFILRDELKSVQAEGEQAEAG